MKPDEEETLRPDEEAIDEAEEDIEEVDERKEVWFDLTMLIR